MIEHEIPFREAAAALAGAVNRGDAAAAACLYADDARLLVPAAAPIAGRREIEAYWREGVALGVAIELEPDELELAGPLAVEIGRYTVSLEDGFGPAADRGTYLVLHRQQSDGSWRRAVDVFNPDGPGARRHAKEEA